MNKKVFLIAFIVTNFIFGSLFFLINKNLNRDENGFVSTIPTINADELKKESNYVISIVSYGCPGHPYFMPELKKDIEIIKQKGYKLFIINDSEYSQGAETKIKEFAKRYKIDEDIYLIDPHAYPTNGGFFNSKTRYFDFVNSISDSTENLLLGYGYYLVFKNGKLVYDNYSLNPDSL